MNKKSSVGKTLRALLSLCPCEHALLSHGFTVGCAYAGCDCNVNRPPELTLPGETQVHLGAKPRPEGGEPKLKQSGQSSSTVTPECDYCGHPAALIIYCLCRHRDNHNHAQACNIKLCINKASEFIGRRGCEVRTAQVGQIDTSALLGINLPGPKPSETCRQCGASKRPGKACL